GTWHDARVRTTPSSEMEVRLAKPLERSIRAGHPWVYRDALALGGGGAGRSSRGGAKRPLRGGSSGLIPKSFGGSSSPVPGTVSPVAIIGTDGKFVARGLFDAKSPIAVRIATLDPREPLDESLVRTRLSAPSAPAAASSIPPPPPPSAGATANATS